MTGYRSQPYTPEHYEADAFDSGEPALDEWLRGHAVGADARRTARTFVWTAAGDPVGGRRVLAHYSLTGHRVVRDELYRAGWAAAVPRRSPPSCSPASPSTAPPRAHGLAGAVLADAMSRVVEAPNIVAASSSSTPCTSTPPPSTSITASPASLTPCA